MWSENVTLNVAEFRPIGQYVLVKKEVTRLSKGGLIIPDIAVKDSKRGVVAAVGDGYTDPDTGIVEPCPVKVGDEVLVMWSSGRRIHFSDEEDGDDYRVVQQHAIIGVFDEDPV